MSYAMRVIVSTLFTLTLAVVAAFGQLIPGQDAYRVSMDAVELPDGQMTRARDFVIKRPAPGTAIPGVVLVKTRAVHGFHNNNNLINGSSANTALTTVNVRSVSSAFTTRMASITEKNHAIESAVGLDRIYEIRYDEPIDPFDLCIRLMESPDVEYAVPVYMNHATFIPNDPRYNNQPWLKNMGLEEAWEITTGSPDVLIAVIDSGTDWQHEDLSSRIWTNPNEVPNNGVDDDQNGYIDDVRGWDFIGNVTQGEAQAGIRRPDNDPRVNFPTINNINGHGTVVAGCVSAHTNNATGIAAPGYNCRIIPIKVGSDNSAVRGIYDGYNAIRYAADLGADIINCSWGGPGVNPAVQSVIDYATAQGALVVAASGNDGQNNDFYQQSPAVLEGVLSVGSVNNNDRVSGFANYGWSTYVYAPGQNILSTVHGNGYGGATGTSFSSPLTSGIAGLIKSIHPDWTPEMIREQIRSTAAPLSNVAPGDRPLYFGRADAENALKMNRNGFSGANTVPGIKLNNVTIESGSRITSYNPTNVSIELKNVLGDASNVTAQFVSRTSGVTFSPESSLDYGTIVHDGTKEANLVVQLNENFPWFETDVTLEITVRSGGYINYVLVNIPVRLPTSNQFQYLVAIGGFAFNQVALSPDQTLYASGVFQNSAIFVRGSANGQTGFGAATMVPSDIAAISSTQVLFGGTRNDVATIARSTNAGQNWNNISVANIMGTVEGVHMYDNTTGIAVGDPATNRFGIARTTNGGQNWSAYTNAPLTNNASESVIPGTPFFLGDGAWFATTEGRVIFTKNRGQSFGQGRLNVPGAEILSVAFRDLDNGVLLYETNGQKRIAHTNNGGAAWVSDRFNPATLGIDAIAVNSSGGHHVLIGSLGEVFGSDNNGVDWQPVLSRPSGDVASTFMSDRSPNSVFFAGSLISLLEYRYSGPNGSKILELTEDQIDYDTLDVDRSRQRFVQVRNVGEADVMIDSVVVTHLGSTPDNSFRITAELEDIIISGQNDQLGVRCYGTDTGRYEAIVTIYTNATPPTLTANLTAYVKDPTVSVEEEILASSVVVAPNPTTDAFLVNVPLPSSIVLINSVGQEMRRWNIAIPGSHELNVQQFPSGTYSLVITSGSAVHTVPVVVQR